MPFDFSQVKDDHLIEVLKKTPHLLNYLDNYTTQGNPLPINPPRAANSLLLQSGALQPLKFMMQLNWKKEICNYRGKENVKRNSKAK